MVLIPTASAQSTPKSATEHVAVKVDAKIFDGYVGRYQIAPNFLVSITREGDHLYAQATGQERFELFAESAKEYFAKVALIQVSFKTDDHGKATEFVLHQGGQDITCKRLEPKTAASLSPHFAEIDSMVAADFAKRPVGSVTVGVVSGKQLIWTKSYGDADMENRTPADQDTVYRIGSITKMFTALMLEQLVEAGKVHLSDPAEKYFPEIKTVQDRFPGAPPVTLVQLATHTAGLGMEPDDLDTYLKGPVSTWEKTLIAALPHTHYKFEPGTRFSYSNIGFAILGAALARAAGEPYVEYVPQHIFEPLGMTHSALEPNPEMLPHLSKGYEVGPSGVDAKTPQREHAGRGYKVPNGAIYTTVGDLARFASFLMGEGPESVLKAASLERFLTQSAVQADFNLSSGYGLGFGVIRRDNYIAFGHSGGVAGYTAMLQINRQAGVGVIVLANGPANTGSLALRSLDILSK
jgi:D-alanyl-D-alanine carboxypeptidase